MNRRSWIIFSIFVLALVSRLSLTALTVGGEPIPRMDDQLSYDLYALRIASGSGWLTEPVSYREVGYPLFLSLVYRAFGHNYFAARAANAFLGALTCIIVFLIAERIFGFLTATLASFWASLYFHFVHYSSFLLRETMVTLLFLSFLLLLYLAAKKRGKKFICVSSLVYVLLVHTDARFLFYVPFVFLYLLAYRPGTGALKRYGFFLLVFVASMIPWQFRNYVVYKKLVLINTRTFVAALPWVGTERGEGAGVGEESGQAPEEVGVVQSFDSIPSMEKQVPAGKTIRELRGFRRKLYDFTEFFRVFRFRGEIRAGSYRYEKPWSLKHNLSSILMYGLLIPFFLFGYFLIIKRGLRDAYILVLPLAAHTILHLLKWGRPRYRVPIEPALIIVAFFGLLELFTHYGRNRGRFGVRSGGGS